MTWFVAFFSSVFLSHHPGWPCSQASLVFVLWCIMQTKQQKWGRPGNDATHRLRMVLEAAPGLSCSWDLVLLAMAWCASRAHGVLWFLMMAYMYMTAHILWCPWCVMVSHAYWCDVKVLWFVSRCDMEMLQHIMMFHAISRSPIIDVLWCGLVPRPPLFLFFGV